MPMKGCIETKPSKKKVNLRAGDDLVRRVVEIHTVLHEILKRCRIDLIVAELPHGSQNHKGAIMIGTVVGILQTLANFKGIPLEWYSEKDAKTAAGLTDGSSKQMVMDKMAKRFGLRYEYKTNKERRQQEAMADAMLIYHAALVHSPFLAHLKGEV